LRRAVVVSKGPALLEGDLPGELLQPTPALRPIAGPAGTAPAPIAPSVPPGDAVAESTPPATEAVSTDPALTGDIRPLALQLFRWARLQRGIKVLPAVERELVIEALKETQGNQVQAAKLLGITRATLRKRVDKFGIRRELNVS